MVYTLRFFCLQNAVCVIILTYLVPVLFTFYIQGVLKFVIAAIVSCVVYFLLFSPLALVLDIYSLAQHLCTV